MYGKVFQTIFTGSLYGQFEATVTMMASVVLSDREGVLDYTPEALAGATGFPVEIIKEGLEQLQQPDPNSRTNDYEGRRIVPLEEGKQNGWLVVNKEKYVAIKDMDDIREQAKLRKRRQREKQAQVDDSEGCHADVTQGHAKSRHIDKDVDQDKDKDEKKEKNTTARSRQESPPEFDDFKLIYPERGGNQPWGKALKTINARLKDGATWPELIDGAGRYAVFCKATGKLGTEYVLQATTFCGPEQHYLKQWNLPATKADVRLASNVNAVAEFMERTNGS